MEISIEKNCTCPYQNMPKSMKGCETSTGFKIFSEDINIDFINKIVTIDLSNYSLVHKGFEDFITDINNLSKWTININFSPYGISVKEFNKNKLILFLLNSG
jgi:hypothetical protein